MTIKRSSKISADENQEIFQEKVKFWKFFSESEIFSKIWGEIWNRGGKCIMVSGGMDASAWMANLTNLNNIHLISGPQFIYKFIKCYLTFTFT